MKIEVEAGYNTLIQERGSHKKIPWLIHQHSFRGHAEFLTPSSWCTYIILTDEMHEKLKDRIELAPWNGGQTYYRKIKEEHIGISADLAEKWNEPYWRIGDDFQHLWDNERYYAYNLDYMKRHIEGVIDFILETEPTAKESGE